MVTKKTTRTSTRKYSNANNDLTDTDILNLPLLPIRNTVLLPNLVTPLIVGREQSIKAIEEAMNKDRILFVVTQLNEELEDPGQDDVYTVGVEGMIDRVLKMPDGTTSVLLHGQRRLRRLEYTQQTPFMRVRAEIVDEETERTLTVEALVRAALALFEKCVKLSNTFSEEAYITAMNIDQPGWLADFIVSALEPPVAVRQSILEAFSVEERLQKTCILLTKELNILELENQIHSQVQLEVDKSQREYFLREQLKAIQRELGETDPTFRENADLGEKILSSGMPEEVKVKANKELDRLNSTPSMAPEGGVIRTYLDWLVSLPWNNATEDQLDIKEAARILE
ncbi:MAG TPA: LON peptidase substrate-binding domain-containing protein [Ktedonobacteraceae bacterium]